MVIVVLPVLVRLKQISVLELKLFLQDFFVEIVNSADLTHYLLLHLLYFRNQGLVDWVDEAAERLFIMYLCLLIPSVMGADVNAAVEAKE